jgi:hypothetical protein
MNYMIEHIKLREMLPQVARLTSPKHSLRITSIMDSVVNVRKAGLELTVLKLFVTPNAKMASVWSQTSVNASQGGKVSFVR